MSTTYTPQNCWNLTYLKRCVGPIEVLTAVHASSGVVSDIQFSTSDRGMRSRFEARLTRHEIASLITALNEALGRLPELENIRDQVEDAGRLAKEESEKATGSGS